MVSTALWRIKKHRSTTFKVGLVERRGCCALGVTNPRSGVNYDCGTDFTFGYPPIVIALRGTSPMPKQWLSVISTRTRCPRLEAAHHIEFCI